MLDFILNLLNVIFHYTGVFLVCGLILFFIISYILRFIYLNNVRLYKSWDITKRLTVTIFQGGRWEFGVTWDIDHSLEHFDLLSFNLIFIHIEYGFPKKKRNMNHDDVKFTNGLARLIKEERTSI